MVQGKESEAKAIRDAIAGLGRGRTTRLPDEIRQRVIDYARRGRAEGRRWSELAEAVGLGVTTVQQWVGAAAVPKARVTFVPVQVTAREASPEASSRLTIRTTGGVELEGVSLEQAIVVLRALG